jgi:hypothetical protein
MMKTFSALALVSILHGATAFVAPTILKSHFVAVGSQNQRLFSYLSSLGGEDLGNTPQQNNEGGDGEQLPKNPKDFFARRADEDRTVRIRRERSRKKDTPRNL